MKRLAAPSVVAIAVAIFAGTASASTGPGSQLDFTSKSASTTISGSAVGTTTATAIVTGSSVTYDGSTKVAVTFDSPAVESNDGGQWVLAFYLDGTYQGAAWEGAGSFFSGVSPTQYFTPSAGAHTFSARMWVGDGSGGQVAGTATLTVTQVSGTWGSTGSSTLAGLSDVNVTSPATGDVLTYDSSTSKWKNAPDTDTAGTSGSASCGTSTTPACMVDVSYTSNAAGFLNNLHDDLFVLIGAVIGAPLVLLIVRWFTGGRD